MDEMIKQLVEKTGIDEATANKVADFIKDHISDIPGWLGSAGLGGLEDQIKGLLGGLGGN